MAKRRSKRGQHKILNIILITLVLVLCIWGVNVGLTMEKEKRQKEAEAINTIDEEAKKESEPIEEEQKKEEEKEKGEVVEEKEPEYPQVEGIRNILLIGTDARTLDEKSRSDSIMILSVDSVHKKLKLTSIMRDSYVDIPEHGEQKINHAFFYGGPELLMKTVENNFKIDIDHYAIINFFGFKDLVDSLGGIDVEVKENEISPINDVIYGTIKQMPEFKKDFKLLEQPGMQHLNGLQALAYSRVRHVGNGDIDRSKRQREVISIVIGRLKDTPVIKYPMVITKFLPYMKTDMNAGDIASYAYTVYKIGNFNPEQIQMPTAELSVGKTINKKKGWVWLMDKEQNSKILQDFIYEDKEYDKNEIDKKSFEKVIQAYIAKEAETASKE